MQLTVLVDNAIEENSTLETEHGLSFLLLCGDSKVLIDTGAGPLFVENARKLGIDISEADYLILSHAHADHTGGLATFIENNDKAEIYLSANVLNKKHYSARRGAKRDISLDNRLLSEYRDRFVFVENNIRITENISLICEIPSKHGMPKANGTLYANDCLDDFSHEIAICVDEGRGAALLSPCSHRGIMNILDAATGFNIKNFVGGLHLIDSDERNTFETENEIISLADEIKCRGISLYTGHCTGLVAKSILSRELGEKYKSFYSGYSVEL